jgi:hypothetical protein
MSKKYASFRNRYSFVPPVVGPHANVTLPCECCASTKYDRYTSNFVVVERRLDCSEMLGDAVQKAVCTKCLHYLYNQNLEVFKTTKRKQQYNKTFKSLLDWCVVNQDLVRLLPTLSRFQQLTSDGLTFKPELVAHVANIIALLKTQRVCAEYLRCWVEGSSRVLLLKIDSLDLVEADRLEMKKYIERVSSSK